MKKFNIFYIVIFLGLCSCGNQKTPASFYEEAYNNASDYTHQENESSRFVAQESNSNQIASAVEQKNRPKQNQASNNRKIVMHQIKDGQNRTIGQAPFPSNWSLKGTNVQGPNGIKSYELQGGFYMYSNDQWMQQIYQQSGQPMQRPKGVNRIIKEDLTPKAQQLGSTFIRQYPLPQVAQANKNYSSQLYKSMPMQENFQAVATEWKDNKGNIALVIVNYQESAGQGMINWGYYYTVFESEANVFEQAKANYLKGISQKQFTAAHFQEYNQKEMRKAQVSNTAHQQRMTQNQANFDAQQQAYRSSNDAINKSIMDSYNNNNAASDRGQQNFINAINEESTMYNSTNGQNYQVESGYNQTWMNSNGEYIQSNDYFYNPNTDPGTNNYNWEQSQEVNW